jgi:hypothetical protein
VLQADPLLGQLPLLAVGHHGEGHAVEVTEAVLQGVVAVVGGRGTVKTQVPLPWGRWGRGGKLCGGHARGWI